jgi:hypothetical protein
MATSTSRKRQNVERQAKLAKVAEQIRAGTLRIKQASEEQIEQWRREREQREAKQRHRRARADAE